MTQLSIFYGTIDRQIDITKIAIDKCTHGNKVILPKGDTTRAALFGDPAIGRLKYIFLQNNITQYTSVIDETQDIVIDLSIEHVLHNIQQQLKLEYGTFYDEYPEQLMAVKYIKGNEKVLELGGNIGRNSLIIGYLLNKCNNNNFVTLESDTEISVKLKHNRDINKLDFFVENMALSKRNLIQTGWNTIVSDEQLEGYKKVNTITLDELRAKYKIAFDTLVLDCEGAFYYILVDMPEILDTVNLIIMENDYSCIEHKQYVDKLLIERGFYVDYSNNAGRGQEPYVRCCFDNFFEVWIRG
jgi:FkbM family methyltransferase